MNSKWIPDRKVWAGGIASVVAFFIGMAVGLDPDVLTPVVIGVYGLVAYLVPPSVLDWLNRVDGIIRSTASATDTERAEMARVGKVEAAKAINTLRTAR